MKISFRQSRFEYRGWRSPRTAAKYNQLFLVARFRWLFFKGRNFYLENVHLVIIFSIPSLLMASDPQQQAGSKALKENGKIYLLKYCEISVDFTIDNCSTFSLTAVKRLLQLFFLFGGFPER